MNKRTAKVCGQFVFGVVEAIVQSNIPRKPKAARDITTTNSRKKKIQQQNVA